MDLVAQPTLGTNTKAVADDQHAHHQFGINRGPSDLAGVGPMRPQIRQVNETVDPTKQVIVGNVPLRLSRKTAPPTSLAARPSSANLPSPSGRKSATDARIKRSFSTQYVDSGRPVWRNERSVADGVTNGSNRTKRPAPAICRRPRFRLKWRRRNAEQASIRLTQVQDLENRAGRRNCSQPSTAMVVGLLPKS